MKMTKLIGALSCLLLMALCAAWTLFKYQRTSILQSIAVSGIHLEDSKEQTHATLKSSGIAGPKGVTEVYTNAKEHIEVHYDPSLGVTEVDGNNLQFKGTTVGLGAQRTEIRALLGTPSSSNTDMDFFATKLWRLSVYYGPSGGAETFELATPVKQDDEPAQ